MVYTGPSKGCLACLKRRVKCDEGKPQCQRCQKAGRECPGYRDPSRIKIRDMTATTINRFEYDRAGPKAKEDGLFDQNYSQSVISLRTRMNEETRRFRGAQAHDDDDDNDEEQTDPVAKRTASNQRSASPSAGWNDNAMNTFVSRSALRVPPWTPPGQHAIAYLTNCYLNVEHQSMDPGYLDVLKLVMRRRNPGQCLQSTLSTLALAAFSRRPVSRAATLDTQASYSVALKTVNDAIGAPGSIFDDELLASIVILALVECLISTKTTGYFNHLYGGITILKARGKRKFHDELGAELFMLLRFELFRTSIIRFAEPQDKYSCSWVKSAMEIVDNPCLHEAHSLTAHSRQNRLSSVIHSSINKAAGDGQSIHQPRATLRVPPAFATDEILNCVVDDDPDLLGTATEYLNTTANFFALPDIHGHPTQDFRPIPWDMQLNPSRSNLIPAFPLHMQSYTWKTQEHASLVLSMLTSKLFGCNVAETFVEMATRKIDARKTAAYRAMMDAAREAIDIIVGSIPFLCGQEEDGGGGLNDYMWLHNAVALMAVAESPFSTAEHRDYLDSINEYVVNVKGIKMAEACTEQCRNFRVHISDELQQAPVCTQSITG